MRGQQTPSDVEFKVCRAYQAGSSWRTIAKAYGMAATTVRHVLVRNGIRSRNATKVWSKSDDDFLIEHYNIDSTALEIAIALGRGRNAVIGRANRLGLSKPINSNSAATGRAKSLKQEMRA